MSRLAVRKTYKLYIGGAFPRSESGRSYVVNDAKGRFLANAALASRKDARDAVVAARKAFAGWSGATAYNRGQVLYRVAEVLEGRRAAVRRGGRAQAEGAHRRRRPTRRRRRGDRPAGLVRRLGRQDRPGRRRRQPGRRPVLQPLDARADRRRRRARAAGVLAARPGQRGRAGDRHRQHRAWSSPSRAAPAAGGHARRGAGHLRRARRRGQHAHRRRRPRSRPWLASHMDVNAHRPDRRRRRRRAGHRRSRWPRPRTSSGCAAPGRRAGLDRRPGPRPDDRLPRDQDGLAPDRASETVPTHASTSCPIASHAAIGCAPGSSSSPDPRGRASRASPSGSGCRSLRLDDFYKDGDDPTLPRSDRPGRNADRRLGRPGVLVLRRRRRRRRAAVPRPGRVDVAGLRHRPRRPDRAPRRSTSAARRTSWRRGSSPRRWSPTAARAGLLADAVCVRSTPLVTFWRRLTRDLREHRKPPLVLVRRGLHLLADPAGRRRARGEPGLPGARARGAYRAILLGLAS